jgi:DNA (cytosine-5)-methyltransferase 1
MTLTVGSLCSGYEATGLGLRLAGWHHRLTFVADNDPAAAKALAFHHPDTPNLGDITAVDWTSVERVDLLHMGFPCTDLSAAGRRAGLGGTRSGVWTNCAEAIAVLRPPLVLIENVRGLLSTPANRSIDATDGDVEPGPADLGNRPVRPVLRAIGAVLGDLSDLRYDAIWTTVSAASVGAPHRRERVFILAWPAADPPRFGHRDGGPAGVGGVPAAAVAGGAGTGDLTLLPTPRSSDTFGPGVHGDGGLDLRTAVTLLPTPRATDGTKGGPNQRGSSGDLMLPSVVTQPDRWGDYAPAIARWEQVVGRPAPAPTEPGSKGQPRLSAAFVEWLQGLPGGYVTDVPGISRNDALRLLGNANPPQQYAAAIRQLAAIAAHLLNTEAAA